MKLEQLKEIMLQAKAKSTNPELVRMADAFETFIDLYIQRGQPHANSAAFIEKLNIAYQAMWQSFEQATAFFGISANMMQQFFLNPSNFSPEQWQQMESMKQEISSSANESVSNTRSVQKKLKKSKNKVRI